MPHLGEITSLLTACCWSFSSYIFTSAAHRVGSIQLNVDRMMFAVIILFITLNLSGINFELSAIQIINLSVSGIIGLVIGDTFLFKAFTLIGTRLSMLLMSLTPAMSAILAYFFLDERISFLGIIGMIITLAGIILVVFDKKENGNSFHPHEAKGILFGVLGALGQAIGMIFAKLAFEESQINGFLATFIRLFASTILIIPMFSLLKRYKNPFRVYKSDTKGLALTLGGTFFGPFLGITLSLISIANTSVGIASTLMSTVPVIMLPIGKFIFKDKITTKGVIGAVIAVAGVAILFLR
ncbi:MAG: DMT family transporter [Ignavibacteriaceae bacterium]|nr:DMT family transporter [Ignavibacteriaceae bacterium]